MTGLQTPSNKTGDCWDNASNRKKHATVSLSLWPKSSKGTKIRKIQPGFYPCPGEGPSTILLLCVIFLFRVNATGQGGTTM